MALSIRDLERVAIELEAQGARVKRTKKGYMCYPVQGRAFAFHLTPSDENSARQLGRDIFKAGLVLPECLPNDRRIR